MKPNSAVGSIVVAVAFAALLVAGCASGPSRDEIEAAKRTIDCAHEGERIFIRFEEGEARLLMPDGTRIILYQVAVASGVRYLNGDIEVRGTSLDLQFVRHGVTTKLVCKPYELPRKEG